MAISPTIQFKRGSSTLITSGIVSFREGEPGFTTDKYDFYIGSDGTSVGNKFFGSSRYWSREDGSAAARLNLVAPNGSDYISLGCTSGHSGITTYTFPSTPLNNKLLSTNNNGSLSWIDEIEFLDVQRIVIGIATFTDNVAFTSTTESTSSSTGAVTITGGLGVGGTSYFGSDLNVVGNLDVTGTVSFGNAGAEFSGITTFSNTEDNTLGDPNTGAVQIDGGLGVDKNVTIGAGLSVTGQSHFIGTATFYGGQINLGDSDTDDIVVSGEFKSNLIPSDDATYDIGINSKRWRNASFSGIGSFDTGIDANNITIGLSFPNEINTSTGDLVLHSTSGVVEVSNRLNVLGDLDVTGDVSIGGTTITIRGEDVFIENKDIILGYTTSVTPNDDTANHAGVAIASTEGTPLVSFAAAGINTLPDTYKQMMWFRSGTLGFSTDAFAFNYGLAVGTTTMEDGIRLAVGSGITMNDDTIAATNASFTTLSVTNLNGNITGTISTATRATTVDTIDAGDNNSTYYLTFVDSNNPSTNAELVYTDSNIYYNPNTDTFTTQNALFNGNVEVIGSIAGTASTSQTVHTTGVSDSSTYYMLFADDSAGQSGETINVSAGASFVPSTNTLKISTLHTGAIKSESGVDSITIQSSSGDVGITTNLTVDGSLVVKGSITSVNSENLKVKDALVDFGLVDDGSGTLVPPSSDANLDIGILLNYYSGSAKKAGVYWDDSADSGNGRVVIASDVTESNGLLTVGTWGTLETGNLYLNGKITINDCSGESDLVTCTGSERFLNNITIDGGAF
jgi:hypothetical protein